MDKNVYFKRGSLSSPEGLFVDFKTYDDYFFGKPEVWGEEINEDEYLSLLEYLKDPSLKQGIYGLVNEEGWEKLQELKSQNQ